MFWFLVQSGLLPSSHISFQEGKAFCSRARSSIFPSSNKFDVEFLALTSWLQSNLFLHGKSSTYFFNGIGGHGHGHTADMNMTPAEWISNHNFAGLTPPSISSKNSTLILNVIVKELSTRSHNNIVEYLRDAKFNNQVLEVHVTSMDDKLSQTFVFSVS